MRARKFMPGWGIWMLLALAGCAGMPREAPPEVASQPPEVTTSEAVFEGMKAAEQAAADSAAAEEAAHLDAPQLPTAVVTAASTRAQRSRPTGRSTEEIRNQNAGAPNPLDFTQRLDHAHDRIYTWGQRAVEATDHRFADSDKPLKPVPAAPFRLGTMFETIDRTGKMDVAFTADLDIALHLPNIEQRARLFITSDELDGGPRENGADSSVRAGLRYELLRHLNFDLGVRVDVPPVAFAAIRWGTEVQMGQWDFYPQARVFIETKESFGYAGGATFDRWSGRHLFRSSTYAKWRHDLDRTGWSHTLIYARAHELIVPDRYGSYPRADDIGRGWGVRMEVSGLDTNQVSRYETGIFIRHPTRNRWLYWHAEPFVQWDRAFGWHADPGIRVGFDALFWDLARPATR
jgi:hypothetical protein